HDLVMIGRAATAPLPEPFRTRLAPALAQAGAAAADYMRASAAALEANRGGPPLAATDAALKGYAAEIEVLRREALTRSLSAEDVERLFALGFAIEQIRINLTDLERCVTEWASDLKKADTRDQNAGRES